MIFPVDGQEISLVFDREERFAEITGEVNPYAALSGRSVVALLSRVGLSFNLPTTPVKSGPTEPGMDP